MNGGLFGIAELEGAGCTTPNYLRRAISPVYVSPNLFRTKAKTPLVGLRGANLEELGPDKARILVDALSNPELKHILNKWHVRHPSGIPLGDIARGELLDLLVQHEGALSEVVRVTEKRSLAETKRMGGPKVRIHCERACTAGYKAQLTMYDKQRGESSISSAPVHDSASMAEATKIFTRRQSDRRQSDSVDRMSPISWTQQGTTKKSKARRKHRSKSSFDAASALKGTGFLSLEDAKQRYKELKDQLSHTAKERESIGLELAKKGLLSKALDGDMCFPVMRSQNMRMEAVRKNVDMNSGFHNNYPVDPDLQGIYIDQLIKTIPHFVSPSTQGLSL